MTERRTDARPTNPFFLVNLLLQQLPQLKGWSICFKKNSLMIQLSLNSPWILEVTTEVSRNALREGFDALLGIRITQGAFQTRSSWDPLQIQDKAVFSCSSFKAYRWLQHEASDEHQSFHEAVSTGCSRCHVLEQSRKNYSSVTVVTAALGDRAQFINRVTAFSRFCSLCLQPQMLLITVKSSWAPMT